MLDVIRMIHYTYIIILYYHYMLHIGERNININKMIKLCNCRCFIQTFSFHSPPPIRSARKKKLNHFSFFNKNQLLFNNIAESLYYYLINYFHSHHNRS